EQAGVPLVIAETRCIGATQNLSLRQDRFVIAPSRTASADDGKVLSLRSWQVPITVGPLNPTRPAEKLLLQGNTEIPAGSCGEPVKVNFGDIGYYRVEYGPKSRAALEKSLAAMAPEDRVNFLADSWALVQAGRA